jgi:hypothetical protein
MLAGIILGPMATKLINSERWGHAVEDQTGDITLVGLLCASCSSTTLTSCRV